MSKLDILIEQSSFLLDQQKESLRECSAIFKDLLNTVETKLNGTTDEEEREALESAFDMLSGQAQKTANDAQEDVDFLIEQLGALNAIKAMPDQKKAKEMLDLLFDENEELEDTAVFKKNLIDEAKLSKQNLLIVMGDLKHTIIEGNAEEVSMFLKSLTEEGDEDQEENEDGCCGDEEEDGCCDDDAEELRACVCGKGKDGKCTCKPKEEATGGCGGCKGCGSGGCGSSKASSDKFDIFELLSEAEEESKTETNAHASSKKTGCC